MYRTKDKEGHVKYAGRSKAIVLDNRDPQERGKIQVTHPILGATVWVEYLHSPGNFTVPSIGDIVFVECDSGHPEYPVCWGNVVKGTNSAPEIPDEFKRDIPTNRGMYSPGGHLIEIDDGIANLTPDKNNPDQTTKSKGIRITTSDGSKIHIQDDSENGIKQILIEDPDGNSFVIDRENGSMDQTIDGKWNVTASDTAKIVSANNTTIEASDITLDAADTLVTGTATVQGDTTLEAKLDVTDNATLQANLQVLGNAQVDTNLTVTGMSILGGGLPFVMATAQFSGTGNLGAPVISTLISGQSTFVFGL